MLNFGKAMMVFAILLVPSAVIAQPELTKPLDLTPTFSVEEVGSIITGSMQHDKLGGVNFAVDYTFSDIVTIRYTFNDNEVTWNIGVGENTAITLESRDVSGTAVVMGNRERRMFQELLHAMQFQAVELQALAHSGNKDALHFLRTGTDLLTTYPVGTPVEVATTRSITKTVTSLCNAVGQTRTAFWTDENNTLKAKQFTVGGHGVCKGHCGGGCPDPGDKTKYSQDCLDHDACVGEENACATCPGDADCGDEWLSASDDWLFHSCP